MNDEMTETKLCSFDEKNAFYFKLFDGFLKTWKKTGKISQLKGTRKRSSYPQPKFFSEDLMVLN